MIKLRRSIAEKYRLESKDLTLEAKKDLDDLKQHLGDDLFDDYMRIRNKISDSDWKNFEILKKKDPDDVRDYVDNFQSKSDKRKQDKSSGSEKIYEDGDWLVLKITSYPAAQKYGSGTKWCITGRYPGHEEKGEFYFNDYIQKHNLDDGYYFFIDKQEPSRKYCFLLRKNGIGESLWNAEDSEISDVDPFDAPGDLKELAEDFLPSPLGNALYEYIEDNAGTNYDQWESLFNELQKTPENMDLERVYDLAQYIIDAGTENLDDYYKLVTENPEAFKTLLRVFPPSDLDSIDHYLSLECLKILTDDIKKKTEWYSAMVEPRFFNTLFRDLINYYWYHTKKYDSLIDKDLVLTILGHCDGDLLDITELPKDFIFSHLPNNILSDKDILNSLLDFISLDDFTDVISKSSNTKRLYDIMKSLIEVNYPHAKAGGLVTDQ